MDGVGVDGVDGVDVPIIIRLQPVRPRNCSRQSSFVVASVTGSGTGFNSFSVSSFSDSRSRSVSSPLALVLSTSLHYLPSIFLFFVVLKQV